MDRPTKTRKKRRKRRTTKNPQINGVNGENGEPDGSPSPPYGQAWRVAPAVEDREAGAGGETIKNTDKNGKNGETVRPIKKPPKNGLNGENGRQDGVRNQNAFTYHSPLALQNTAKKR